MKIKINGRKHERTNRGERYQCKCAAPSTKLLHHPQIEVSSVRLQFLDKNVIGAREDGGAQLCRVVAARLVILMKVEFWISEVMGNVTAKFGRGVGTFYEPIVSRQAQPIERLGREYYLLHSFVVVVRHKKSCASVSSDQKILNHLNHFCFLSTVSNFLYALFSSRE